MTDNPFFSVIIPTYNRAQHISNAIESVLKQTFTDYEIIVVDDGSTDNTAERVNAFQNSGVQYLVQKNSERGAARNNGIRNANGRYVCFLDSDDLLYPNHLAAAFQLITGHSNYKVFCLSYEIGTPGNAKKKYVDNSIHSKLFRGNDIGINAIFIQRDFALDNLFSEDRKLSALEDWELWLRISLKTPIITSPEITSILIEHDARSVLQTVPAEIEKRFDAFFDHIKNNPDFAKCKPDQMKQLYSSCHTYISLHLALTGKYKKNAVEHLKKGIGYSPSAIFTRRFAAIIKHLIF